MILNTGMKISEIIAETVPDIHNAAVMSMLNRGHTHSLMQRPKTQWDGRDKHDLTMHPVGGTPYEYKPGRTRYYDPTKADLQVFNPGEEYLEHQRAMLRPGYSEEIEDLGTGIIYRGMSAEEYQFFLREGRIESTGDYNIGDQQTGLTYWTTEPSMAVSYANSFAPMQHKPTFQHPAYIVAARMPMETRRVKGTGEAEVGVARPILANEIVAIWEGTPYDYNPPSFTVYRQPEGHYEFGGGQGGMVDLVWKRIR
jgi:hypothetical protein